MTVGKVNKMEEHKQTWSKKNFPTLYYSQDDISISETVKGDAFVYVSMCICVYVCGVYKKQMGDLEWALKYIHIYL